ncbi:hypothetical protein WB401_35625 [Streptomyces brasiliscabiei]|uniref:Uncharacterized protein n=1 Tax=Streptomyces brasiliscabiei TaxID=2736302 RepID=A0ABU8G9V6_9ACTN
MRNVWCREQCGALPAACWALPVACWALPVACGARGGRRAVVVGRIVPTGQAVRECGGGPRQVRVRDGDQGDRRGDQGDRRGGRAARDDIRAARDDIRAARDGQAHREDAVRGETAQRRGGR